MAGGVEVATPSIDRGWLSGAIVGVGAIAAVTITAAGDGDDGFVLCPLRRCTGVYCPGCGGTRAAAKLVRGDVVGSWHQHPFVALLAMQALVLGVIALRPAGKEWVAERWMTLVYSNTAFFVALWVVRLGRGDIPGPF
jgi:hypothetical protein